MTPVPILDTDFLSAFLKIEKLTLVRDFYDAEVLRVPPAVYREVSLTPLITTLANLPWIRVEEPRSIVPPAGVNSSTFQRLGSGEQEAIVLAMERTSSVLLTNDNLARSCAVDAGLHVVNIPAFLLACKMSGFQTRDEIAQIVGALQDRDRYAFRKDVLALILS